MLSVGSLDSRERRERVFLVFAGIFLGSMAMLNILGITRLIHIRPLALVIGVLPYPLTFLCTDFISEFYGRVNGAMNDLAGRSPRAVWDLLGWSSRLPLPA